MTQSGHWCFAVQRMGEGQKPECAGGEAGGGGGWGALVARMRWNAAVEQLETQAGAEWEASPCRITSELRSERVGRKP